MKNEREIRRCSLEFRAAETEENKYIVEGYATTFNQPYVLWEEDGIKFSEQIDKNAFDGADMRDVIMQYDHEGMVYARNKNGTLQLTMDDHGLKVRADLSSTQQSREMYEAIATGLVSEMSFAFTVAEEAYDNETRTRTIARIKKLYDVSAVSIPANPFTDIGVAARSLFNGVIEEERAERLAEVERQKAKIRILTELE